MRDKWWNVLIKISNQIANTFAKTINGYKGEVKILSNIWDGAFSASSYWLQKLKAASRSLLLQKPPFWMFEYASELASKVKDVSFLNQFEYEG